MVEVLDPIEGKCWKVYMDGASNAKGVDMGIVIFNTKKGIIEQSVRINFQATNNMA